MTDSQVAIWLPGEETPTYVQVQLDDVVWDLDDSVEWEFALVEAVVRWASGHGYVFDDLYFEDARSARLTAVIDGWWNAYEDNLTGLAKAARDQHLIPWCDETGSTFENENGFWGVSKKLEMPAWLLSILTFPVPGRNIDFALLMESYTPPPELMSNAALEVDLGDVSIGNVVWPNVVIKTDTRGIVLMDPNRNQNVLHALVTLGVLEYDILEGRGVFRYPLKGESNAGSE